MAAIDKIYVNSYDHMCQFRDWCKGHTITDKYGVVKSLTYWGLFYWEEETWNEDSCYKDCSHPVYSAPYLVDYYLIRNCPFDFIQDRLKVMYGEEDYNEIKNTERYYKTDYSVYDLVEYCRLPEYEPGTHFTIQRVKSRLIHTKNGKFVKCNRVPLHKEYRDSPYWDITIYKDQVTPLSNVLQFMMYSEPIKKTGQKRGIGTWDNISDLVIADWRSSSCNDCKTIKALTRRIRKWKLPVGTVLHVASFRYPNDDYYKIVIKK